MKIVITACICDDEEQQNEIVAEFKKAGMEVSYAGQYDTLAGHGGEGGRTDLVFDLSDKDVSHAAVHPWHLTGLFRWADDYYRDNHNIIPEENLSLFEGYTHYTE